MPASGQALFEVPHHVRHYLIPSLGQTRLADLTCAQLTAMFAEMTADTYLTILPVIQWKAAEATARLVVNTARKVLAKAKPGGLVRPPETPAPRTLQAPRNDRNRR